MQEILQALEDIKIGKLSLSTLLSAAVVFLICAIAVKIISRIVSRALEKSRMEKALKTFIGSAAKVALWVLTIIIVADGLGIPTASLVAALSVAGLALSLSLQNIMSNLFSGMTVLTTKPFASGDYVELGGVSGTVDAIGLFHTTIKTPDNKLIYIPNSDVTSSKIINYSHEANRRVDMSFTVSYDSKPAQVRAAVEELIAGEPRIMSEPAPFLGLSEYGASSIKYVLRIWTKNEDYWTVYFSLSEKLLSALEKRGADMCYDHLNVHIVNE